MDQELNYTKGFNDGYKLQKYSEHLFEKLKDTLSEENEYERGMLEGAVQAQKEKEQERMAELESLRDEQAPEQEQEEDMER